MKILNIFKKAEPQNNFLFFQVTYQEHTVFGVTAVSANEAEELICEQIFHNQTIPGISVVESVNIRQIKSRFPKVSTKKVKKRGIWYPS